MKVAKKPEYIYWEESGGQGEYRFYRIYFNPKGGIGTYFNIDGGEGTFSHVQPTKSSCCRFDTLPNEIQFSLMHYGGIPTIKIPYYMCSKPILDLINEDKDFRIINKSIVEAYIKLKEAALKSIEDISNYKYEINCTKNVGIPYNFVKQIFNLVKVKRANCINGEIGISSFLDSVKLEIILRGLNILEDNKV